MKNVIGLKPPWKKGVSGNPKGHKSGVRHWSTVLKNQFESGKVSQDDLAVILISKAVKGDLKALAIIFDKMDKSATISSGNNSLSIAELIAQGHERIEELRKAP